jgi:hypothetical protein
MFCFAAAQSRAGQSSAPGKDSVRIDVVESSEQLHESFQEKSPLQFGSNRSPDFDILIWPLSIL